jgi:hypothetical protein
MSERSKLIIGLSASPHGAGSRPNRRTLSDGTDVSEAGA